MLVIGSVAMQYHGIAINRKCGDVDIIATPSEVDAFIDLNSDKIRLNEVIAHPHWKKIHLIVDKTHYEFEIATEGSTAEQLLKLVEEHDLSTSGFANPDVLLAFKLSHRYKKNSKFFGKTMQDIRTLRTAGAVVPLHLQDWFKRRETESYTNKLPNLKQSKANFFDTPGVEYKYDHDSIHRAIARFEQPCYEYFKDDLAEVFCSKEKFFSQPKEKKLGAVVEESLVLALERCLVPYHFHTPATAAFLMALEKVCTSITGGWFREYAYDNYYDAIDLFENQYKDFVDKFMDGLYNGTIKMHEVECVDAGLKQTVL